MTSTMGQGPKHIKANVGEPVAVLGTTKVVRFVRTRVKVLSKGVTRYDWQLSECQIAQE